MELECWEVQINRSEGIIINRKIFSPIKDEFIQLYESCGSSRKLGKHYKVDKATILNYANKIGYKYNHELLLNQEEINDIISKYYTHTSKELAEIYKVSESRISQIFMQNNLKGKLRYVYSFNQDYFNIIDSKDKAYFLGWLASDGCVSSKGGGYQSSIRLSLHSDDKYILHIFQQYLQCNKPISYSQTKTTNVASLEIISDKMANDLKQYNIIPNKTNIFNTVILKNYMSHFIRGYFDGDGSISYKDINKLNTYQISISGFEHNLNIIINYLCNYGIKTIFVQDKRNNRYSNLSFGSLYLTNITYKYCFLKYLYSECDDLYLSRKKTKADIFIDLVENTNNKRCKDALNYYNSIVNNFTKLSA